MPLNSARNSGGAWPFSKLRWRIASESPSAPTHNARRPHTNSLRCTQAEPKIIFESGSLERRMRYRHCRVAAAGVTALIQVMHMHTNRGCTHTHADTLSTHTHARAPIARERERERERDTLIKPHHFVPKDGVARLPVDLCPGVPLEFTTKYNWKRPRIRKPAREQAHANKHNTTRSRPKHTLTHTLLVWIDGWPAERGKER